MRKNSKYYNNGVVNKMISEGDPIPEGFVLGMVKRSEEQKRESDELRKKTCIEKYGGIAPLCSGKIKAKAIKTNLERYGVDNPSKSKEIKDKREATNIEKYGVSNTFQGKFREKQKQTNLERYGVENPFQSDKIKEKIKKTNLERYGVEYPIQSEGIKEKAKQTTIRRFGSIAPLSLDSVREKAIETNIEKYGVPWTCMRPEARRYSNNSSPNRKFHSMLSVKGIECEREFMLGVKSYDFKVGNILIEIDPYATHNTIWYPFGNHVTRITKSYHLDKTLLAEEAGYRVIHIFDWDDLSKIVGLLGKLETVYARNCVVREVSIDDTGEFLQEYHLQGSCRGQDVRLGLYHSDELVSLMTFGKPRYNKNYQWELLRYSTVRNVLGGAQKLFAKFIREYKPDSVISYCDRSKFRGDVYKKLGFLLLRGGEPSCHWYSPKEKRHITDNMLRKYGYDILFNESYGKGTSNEELIIKRGYYPIYDCGQDTYLWVKDKCR